MESKFTTELSGSVLKIHLSGKLDPTNAPALMEDLKTYIGEPVEKIVFFIQELVYMSSGGLRAIIFAKQKVGNEAGIYMIGAQEMVTHVLKMSGLDDFVTFQDSYDE
jgi:anti-anti-sigma factor